VRVERAKIERSNLTASLRQRSAILRSPAQRPTGPFVGDLSPTYGSSFPLLGGVTPPPRADGPAAARLRDAIGQLEPLAPSRSHGALIRI